MNRDDIRNNRQTSVIVARALGSYKRTGNARRRRRGGGHAYAVLARPLGRVDGRVGGIDEIGGVVRVNGK